MSESGQRPGWYPDPSGAVGTERWRNGVSWGEQTRVAGWTPGPGAPGPGAPGPGWTGPGVPTRKPRHTGRIVVAVLLAGLAVVGVFVGGIIWLVLGLTGGPRDAANGFFTELGEGRVDAAAARLCARYSDQGVDRLTTAYPEPVIDFDVNSVNRVNDTATVTGDLTVGSASAYPVTVQLVREQGEWKVCSLPG